MRTPAHRSALRRRQAVLTSELLVEGGGIGGHRAVEVDRNVRYQPVALEFVQVVHQ
ncbi:hypothetical protein D3C80_1984420 [compost metagenome]